MELRGTIVDSAAGGAGEGDPRTTNRNRFFSGETPATGPAVVNSDGPADSAQADKTADFVLNDPYLKTALDVYNEGTISGYKMSIIEASKILDAVLLNKHFPGKTMNSRLISARAYIPNISSIINAENKKYEIINNLEYNLTHEIVKESLHAYSAAIGSLITTKPKGILAKHTLAFKTGYKRIGLSKLALVFFLFVGLVIFLSRTALGLSVVKAFLSLIDTVVSGILVLGGLGLVLIATFVYLENKRSKA